MPRAAHRRCKEQGPTCLGVTHPGFDVCSRCLFDVIRPRMREEKEAVRRRKAARLSQENRALITATDLKEPQMRTDVESWQAIDEPAKPISLRRAVHEELLVEKLSGMIEVAQQNGLEPESAYQELILRTDMDRYADVPVLIDGPEPDYTEPELATEGNPFIDKPLPRVRRGRGGKTPITAEQRKEIADAYAAGMPVNEICRAWDIGIGALYLTIDAFGIARRGRPGGSAHSTRPVKEQLVPATSSKPASHTPAEAPSANGRASGLPEWVVTYQVVQTLTRTVAAKSFNDAAAAVESDGVEVLSVARKTAS